MIGAKTLYRRVAQQLTGENSEIYLLSYALLFLVITIILVVVLGT